MSELDESERRPRGASRRAFLASGAAGLAASAAAGLTGCAPVAPAAAARAAIPTSGGPGQRVLLKGGVVLTMDPRLGDFEKADVLIEGSKIAAVVPNLPAGAPTIDASNIIVMPGFVDTHRHIWQGQLRIILPNGRLDPDYFRDIGASARRAYRPEVVYVGDLLRYWGANDTGSALLLALARMMGPDVTYIHCCNLTAEEWKLIADSRGSLSLASPIEMEMGHGIPPIQQALDHKIPWSLSNDVETEIPSDFFTQMRTNFFLQRMQIFARERAKEANVPPLLTVKDIVHVATIGGARANWLDKRTGSLTPGKEADVVLLAANAINVMPLNHAYGAIALGMDTSNVDAVFVAGRVKKWKGDLVGVDVDQLRARAERSRDYVRSEEHTSELQSPYDL